MTREERVVLMNLGVNQENQKLYHLSQRVMLSSKFEDLVNRQFSYCFDFDVLNSEDFEAGIDND